MAYKNIIFLATFFCILNDLIAAENTAEYLKAYHAYFDGKCEDALPNIEKAYAENPTHINVVGLRAQVYDCLNRLEDALAAYSLALSDKRLRPQDKIATLLRRVEVMAKIDREKYSAEILRDLDISFSLLDSEKRPDFYKHFYIGAYERKIKHLSESKQSEQACKEIKKLGKIDQKSSLEMKTALKLKCSP